MELRSDSLPKGRPVLNLPVSAFQRVSNPSPLIRLDGHKATLEGSASSGKFVARESR